MPWPARTTVKMREEFVLRALGKVQPFAEVCREFQVSRKTGYKWLERYKEQGLPGLVDESRRPESSPTKVDDEMVAVILALRREFPKWGPKKLRALMLRRKPGVAAPCEGTIARLLRENGLVKKFRRRERSWGPPERPPQLDPMEPNDVWTVDFKGWWRTRDGVRCEPLTVRDARSRYLLGVRILASTATEDVMPEFELLFDKYGLPKTIQTDNGAPFASTRGIGGLSQLSAWWVSLGINVVRSRPGCPQDNGGHERMHGDMLALQHISAPTVREQQQRLDEWVTTFNHVRPHEALGMKTPAEFYRPSPRRRNHHRIGGFPLDARLVNVRGRYAHFDDKRIHVGAAFEGYPVGIRPLDGGRVEVWFFHMRLGTCVPGENGSFEVDAALVSPTARERRARVVRELRTPDVRRTAGTALLLASSTSTNELASAMQRTTVALLRVDDERADADASDERALTVTIMDALAALDAEGGLGGLVALPDLRAELVRREVAADDQAVNAALYELERAWRIDLSIAQSPTTIADRRAGIEDPRGLVYYVVRRAVESHHAGAPSASDGAAGAEDAPACVPSTNDRAAEGARASNVDGVTPCESECVPPPSTCHPACHPARSAAASPGGDTCEVTALAAEVTPVTQAEVTPVAGGGDTPGSQVSPTSGAADDRAALRLQPPTIPVGWPWVSDASRRSRQRKPTNKEPRTTK